MEARFFKGLRWCLRDAGTSGIEAGGQALNRRREVTRVQLMTGDVEVTVLEKIPCLRRMVLGLIVDAASEVLRLPHDQIEAPPEVFEESEVKYVTGVGKLNGRLVILIDLTKILQQGELRRLGDLAAAATA